MASVDLDHDGTSLAAELVGPSGGERLPTVLVAHTALGVRAVERAAADRIVALGYNAIVLDMFGSEFDGDPASAPDFFMALVSDPVLLRSRTVAWFDRCRDLPTVDPDRIAAIGYCFGGHCVLELARSGADLAAAVSFHGLLSTTEPASPGSIGGEVVAWCGALDPYAPPDHVEGFRAEMAEAGASTQITTFGGAAHGFTDPDAASIGRPGIEYDRLADRVSWAGTVAVLDTVLAP